MGQVDTSKGCQDHRGGPTQKLPNGRQSHIGIGNSHLTLGEAATLHDTSRSALPRKLKANMIARQIQGSQDGEWRIPRETLHVGDADVESRSN